MPHDLADTDVTTRQELTRYSESGVYGFINHMDSRDIAQFLLQSISREVRQQMIFRYVSLSLVVELQLIDCVHTFPCQPGLQPAFRKSWVRALLAPYISSCPGNQVRTMVSPILYVANSTQTRLVWQNFPSKIRQQ
jgi:hypothetical protein